MKVGSHSSKRVAVCPNAKQTKEYHENLREKGIIDGERSQREEKIGKSQSDGAQKIEGNTSHKREFVATQNCLPIDGIRHSLRVALGAFLGR